MKKVLKSESIFSYLIPIAFILFAGYQLETTGTIDKYIIGVLGVFGLAAAGWRVDIMLEAYLRAKYGPGERGKPDA